MSYNVDENGEEKVTEKQTDNTITRCFDSLSVTRIG